MAERAIGQAARLERSGARRRGKGLQLAVIALVIAGAVGYLAYSGLRTSVYYQTVSELRAGAPVAGGGQVRVAGVVTGDAIVREDAGSIVRFTMADAGGVLPVTYKGAVPDIFGSGIEVVVEGKYSGGQFVADTLLAKCPSKFDAAAAP
jgi:cytochrome c-type biogenesis protein CcmE